MSKLSQIRTKIVPPPAVTLLVLVMLTAAAQVPPANPFQNRAASYLGLGLRDIDAARARELKLPELSGVEIVAVEQGAAGDQAGIVPGDVILSYNGEKISSAQQLIRLVSNTPIGRRIRVSYMRAGRKQETWVTTGQSQSAALDEPESLFRGRITDVPFPMVVWRNLVLGIESESLNDQLAQALGVKQGILIWTVNAGSLAQRAGLRAGDVITNFCGHAVHSPRDLGALLQQLQNSQKPLSFDAVRDHKTLALSVSLETDR